MNPHPQLNKSISTMKSIFRLNRSQLLQFFKESYWAIFITLALFTQVSLIAYGLSHGLPGNGRFMVLAFWIYPMINIVVGLLSTYKYYKDREFLQVVEEQMRLSHMRVVQQITKSDKKKF